MRFIFKILLNLLMIFTAFAGDYIVFSSKYSNSFIFRAFSDSSVHGIIGFISAIVFFSYRVEVSFHTVIYNVGLCTLLSSLIDIDHFIAAKSIYLKDLHNLKRGIFHCTTLWILITFALFTYSYIYRKINTYLLTFMIILAYISHHVRDGNRRGLYMYPCGHTPPIHKYLYVGLLVVVPNVLGLIYPVFKSHFTKDVIEYKMIV